MASNPSQRAQILLLPMIADIPTNQLYNLDSTDLIEFIGASSYDVLCIVQAAIDDPAKRF